MSTGPGWAAAAELAAFRGEFPVAPLSARRVAGLLDVPGCLRRQVIDAATVSIEQLAGLLGGSSGGQSPFAIARERQFTRRVTGDAMAELLALVRDRLGAPVTAVRQHNLSAEAVLGQYTRGDVAFRAKLTGRYVAEMLAGDPAAVNLLQRPVFTLDVGGAPIYVEPDVVAYTGTDPLHSVAIRSYPRVDGVADPAKVSATAREVAVSLLATRQLAAGLGHDPQRLGTAGLLVLPRNFGLAATGEALDVAPQARRLRRALARFPDPAALTGQVPEDAALPPMPDSHASDTQRDSARARAAEAVGALPPRFGEGCLSCPLFTFCRAEQQAAGTVAQVGDEAANLCGDTGTVAAALALAEGVRAPAGASERALAADLGRAATIWRWVGDA